MPWRQVRTFQALPGRFEFPSILFLTLPGSVLGSYSFVLSTPLTPEALARTLARLLGPRGPWDAMAGALASGSESKRPWKAQKKEPNQEQPEPHSWHLQELARAQPSEAGEKASPGVPKSTAATELKKEMELSLASARGGD